LTTITRERRKKTCLYASFAREKSWVPSRLHEGYGRRDTNLSDLGEGEGDVPRESLTSLSNFILKKKKREILASSKGGEGDSVAVQNQREKKRDSGEKRNGYPVYSEIGQALCSEERKKKKQI